jgi:hypothetical protein
VRSFDPPDGWRKFFCSECGGHVWSQSHLDPEMIGVRLGAIDGDPGIRPTAHQYVAYAASWHPLPDDGLPRYDERMPR